MDNEKKLNILGLAIKILFAVPALIACFIVMLSDVSSADDLVQQEFMNDFWFSSSINITLFSMAVAASLILIFFILLIISQPKQAIKSILGLILSGVVFFILYMIGTNDTVESLQIQDNIQVTQGEFDFTHAGIYTALIGITVTSFVALFMGFFMKLFRN